MRAEAKVIGRAPRRGLVGQALASSVVLAVALAVFVGALRRLRPTGEEPPLSEVVAGLRSAMDEGDTDAALEQAGRLHARLADHRVARDYLPDPEGLTERREATRFGGAEVSVDDLRPLVMPLLAIAGALLDPEARR